MTGLLSSEFLRFFGSLLLLSFAFPLSQVFFSCFFFVASLVYAASDSRGQIECMRYWSGNNVN